MKLLFLPGLMCDRRLFEPLIDHLEAGIESGSMYNYPMLPGEDSMQSIAESVLQQAFHMWGPEADLTIVGLSMGGIAAMECARLYPQRVKALALLDTNAMDETRDVSDRRTQMVDRAGRIGIGSMVKHELLPNLLHPKGLENEQLRELMVSMAEESGLRRYGRHAAALAGRPDYSEVLRKFDGPAVIIAGADDALCPPPRQHHLQSCLPQADLHFLGECGHISTLEKPVSVGRLLELWLRENDLF